MLLIGMKALVGDNEALNFQPATCGCACVCLSKLKIDRHSFTTSINEGNSSVDMTVHYGTMATIRQL